MVIITSVQSQFNCDVSLMTAEERSQAYSAVSHWRSVKHDVVRPSQNVTTMGFSWLNVWVIKFKLRMKSMSL